MAATVTPQQVATALGGGQEINASPTTLSGDYWTGTNGQVYLKAAGVAGANGAAADDLGSSNPALLADLSSYGAKSIANPVSSVTNAVAPTSGSSASSVENKSNDISAQEAAVNGVQPSIATGTAAVNSALAQINGEYASDDAAAQSADTTESNDNEQDLQSNKETALQDAVQGRQGLYGTLASLGALNGDGLTLANNAVAQGANSDLGTAADTYASNANSIAGAYTAYQQQDATRKAQAQAAATNDIEQVQNDQYTAEQKDYNAIANDYQEEGDTGDASKYTALANALQPQISNTNVPTLNIGYTGGTFTAPSLQSYVGQANGTSVQTTPGSNASTSVFNVPGLIAAQKQQNNAVSANGVS
jgi:hypothetical protein